MQRVMRRAGLKMEYSNGFNPHPIMSVALPLSVGVTADAELMKIGLADSYTEEELKKILNDAFPKGFEIVDIKKTEGKEYDFNKINRAKYICILETEYKPDINAFMSNENITVMKKSKSGTKETDIKAHIHSIKILGSDENSVTLEMCTDAGNLYNLKPDTVIDAMNKYIPELKCNFYLVKRCALLCDDKELF